MSWLWSANTAGSTVTLASKPPGSSPVQPTEDTSPVRPTEDTTTHVAPQDDPTQQWKALASPEPPLERPEVGQGQAPTVPSAASTASPDTKEENIAGVGAKILNVALGIRSFVQLWDDTTPTTSSARAGTPGPENPTDPLTTPGPSRGPQDDWTTPWLSTGAPSSPDTQRTEAGTLPPPTQPPPSQPPPSPDRPRALLGEPAVPPPSPGRASLSSAWAGAPPQGSQPPPGWPQELDSKGLLPAAARPGQQHRRPDDRTRTPPPLALVTGSPGVHAAPWALSSEPSAKLSHAALLALSGDRGAWVPHVANPAGPGLADSSALLGAAGRCLPLLPSLALCGHLGIGRFWLPNHLHHASGEEVQAAARAWGALLQTRCHRFLARFFCLLLAPPCGPGALPGPPPCRQFCEALEDACWSRLDGRGLPFPCASLPAREDGRCVFIGPPAGNGRPATRLPSVRLGERPREAGRRALLPLGGRLRGVLKTRGSVRDGRSPTL